MTPEYQFKVDADAEEFCDGIAMRMGRLFGFSLEEAIGRINRCWEGLDFEPYPKETESRESDIPERAPWGADSCDPAPHDADSGEGLNCDIRYHEDDDFWANEIVYGHDSHWWLDPPGLTPFPYPAPADATLTMPRILEYRFKVDLVALTFCDSIAMKMVRLFGFTLAEAVGRIHRRWRDHDFVSRVIETESHPTEPREHDTVLDVRIHEMPELWAKDITYGPESRWWNNPPGLKPLPYP